MSHPPSADVESPVSPSPTSIPSPLFLPPKPIPMPPLDSTSPQTGQPSPSSSMSPSPDPSPSSPGAAVPTSSRGAGVASSNPPSASSGTPSSGEDKGSPVSPSQLRALVGTAFKILTGIAATVATDTVEQDHGLWRPDQEDVENVSAPGARLLYRRLPDDVKHSDPLDIFQLGLALAGYVGKQLHARSALRKLRATGQLDQAPAPETLA